MTHFPELEEVNCPNCAFPRRTTLCLVLYPTFEEICEAAVKGNEEAIRELRWRNGSAEFACCGKTFSGTSVFLEHLKVCPKLTPKPDHIEQYKAWGCDARDPYVPIQPPSKLTRSEERTREIVQYVIVAVGFILFVMFLRWLLNKPSFDGASPFG